MSSGLYDALKWLATGNGTNSRPIKPDDPRWTQVQSYMGDDWDDVERDVWGLPLGDWERDREKCVCGARFTSAPQLHLTWCPKYTPPMGGNFE